ncbi:MAG TPA: TIGR03088 family PEP-CTERM/XrtA system glycosyltransferase [Candidatus Binatia bacterium]|nr:TIGR03088 family PEP-CTERM/XrtA system glycosyltransferase [Candidatus Binatia bacterium]
MSDLAAAKRPPLVAHVIQRLAVGGLENGLVNLINHMPEDRYRHAVICLGGATDYSSRIERKDVPVFTLGQRPGHDFRVHGQLLKLLRRLCPAIVHTRNLAALEFQTVAALAGVPGRIHGEHGRDMHDLDGASRKYNLLRKGVRPFVQRYTAVSQELARWLVDRVGVRPDQVAQVYNGVDAEKFHPRNSARPFCGPAGFMTVDSFVVGTVGRMEPVKDQLTLVRAFIGLAQSGGEVGKRLRLLIVGDGSLRSPAMELLREARMEDRAWLPGERNDIPDLLRSMDLFVLPSLREGVSNTILEAMATALPVVATRVGGNPELVREGETGGLVAHSDPASMARAIHDYFSQPEKCRRHGAAGRLLVGQMFTMENMVQGYLDVYDTVTRSERNLTAERAKNMERSGRPQRAER